MKALLLIVHGSPREESNDDVRRVLERVKQSAAFDFAVPCFLDCNDPDIPTGVAECVAAGATTVVFVPYFLHLGRHVALDIPNHLGECADRYRKVEFLLSPLIGNSPQISMVLGARAREVLQKAT